MKGAEERGEDEASDKTDSVDHRAFAADDGCTHSSPFSDFRYSGESAVSSCAAELLTGRGRGLRGYIGRTYDNGAYLQVYSGDGSTLEAGTDIFGIQSMMPDLLQNNEQEQVFRVTTAEANVYCYFLRLSGVKNERGRGTAIFSGFPE